MKKTIKLTDAEEFLLEKLQKNNFTENDIYELGTLVEVTKLDQNKILEIIRCGSFLYETILKIKNLPDFNV